MTGPAPGQKWNIPELTEELDVFATLMGTYGASTDTPSTPTMSVHLYRLAEGQQDAQQPHNEEELYYVLFGSRSLTLNDGANPTKQVELSQGDLVYVPANVEHRFEGDAEIVLLVFFAPNFIGPEQD